MFSYKKINNKSISKNKNKKQINIYSSTFKLNPKNEKKRLNKDTKQSKQFKQSSLNEFELENLTYKMALKLDKRTYCNYYIRKFNL